jgi:TPR repeat protein
MPTREQAIRTIFIAAAHNYRATHPIYPTAETIIPMLINLNNEVNDDTVVEEDPKEQQDKRSQAEIGLEALRSKKYTLKELELLESKAKKGEKEAQYEFGLHLYLTAQKYDPELLKINKAQDPKKFASMAQESVKFLRPALEWLKDAAKQNMAEALYLLANYSATDPRPKSKEEMRTDKLQTLRWYTRAAIEGHDLALCTVGLFYQIGTSDTPPRNSKTAYNCFLVAAMQGHVGAQYYLGLCYLFGQGIGPNKKKANYWLTRSQGPEKAKNILDFFAETIDEEVMKSFTAGNLTPLSSEVESRDDLAVEQQDKRSKTGRFEAYLLQEIIKRFSEEKIALLTNLVELGYSYAAFKLGFYYYVKFREFLKMIPKPHKDSKQNPENQAQFKLFLEKGLPLLIQAAKDNIVPAQVFLGKSYLTLSKISSEPSKKKSHLQTAYFWISKASDLGYASAQYKMAEAHFHGFAEVGIAKNIPAAQELYRAAAMQGHHKAQLRLATLYLEASKAPDPAHPEASQIKKKGVFWLKTAVGAAAAAKRLESITTVGPAAVTEQAAPTRNRGWWCCGKKAR